MSITDKIILLENIKKGFKRTVSWKEYRSEITTQAKNNILEYLIDATFMIINSLFVLSIKNGNNNPTRDYFDKHYMPLTEITDFNAIIVNKQFFHEPVKYKQEA